MADVVGISERSFFARYHPDPDALIDIEAAGLNVTFLQAPAFGTRILEIQIRVVGVVREDFIEHRFNGRFVEAVWRKQRGTGNTDWGGVHGEVKLKDHALSQTPTAAFAE